AHLHHIPRWKITTTGPICSRSWLSTVRPFESGSTIVGMRSPAFSARFAAPTATRSVIARRSASTISAGVLLSSNLIMDAFDRPRDCRIEVGSRRSVFVGVIRSVAPRLSDAGTRGRQLDCHFDFQLFTNNNNAKSWRTRLLTHK